MSQSSRGILTETDREFLYKDHDERQDAYSRSAISQRWDAIQSRVYHGIEDLEILFDHLPAEHRQEIFNEYEEGLVLHKRSQLFRYSTAFVLLGVAEAENVDLDDEEFHSHLFKHALETVLHKDGFGPRKLDVDVTIEGWSHPNEGMVAGDLSDLTDEQLRYLLFDGQISNDEFAEAVVGADEE